MKRNPNIQYSRMALARERPRHGGAVKSVRAWVVDRQGGRLGRGGAYRDLVERDDGLEVDVVPRRRRGAAASS
jgi:hypothetical protein